MANPIRVKRAYEEPAAQDGARFLVERLWPRGVKKTSLRIEGWFQDAAPSANLRRWFNHDPAKWTAFKRKYFAELNARPDSWAPLVEAARRGPITLVYSARDTEHNNAVALATYLQAHLSAKTRAHQSRAGGGIA